MIGRELSGHYYREDKGEKLSDEIVLEMQSVTAGDLHDVSMQLHRGEILGIGGLSDCGIHTLGKVLYGLIPPSRGEVRKDAGQRVKSPSWAVRHGMAYVSKNRDTESMMLVCSVKDNICLPSLHDLAAFGRLPEKAEKSSPRSGRKEWRSRPIRSRPTATRSAAATSRRSSWQNGWARAPRSSFSTARRAASTSARRQPSISSSRS